MQTTTDHTRFGFGKNWRHYSALIDDNRIAEAERSLKDMLACDSLQGKSFLDIGSGSGLFSLAAARLGARVVSFDYDEDSVACTAALRQKFLPDADSWTVQQGSVLDADFVASLGTFDVVYSWGVLHHTGSMWQALAQVLIPLQPDGQLFIALYNNQGCMSTVWTYIKKLYCSSGAGRIAVIAACIPAFIAAGMCLDLAAFRNPWQRYRDYKLKNRGMSIYYDWIDWLGGYPFEVAAPAEIVDFYAARGVTLQKLKSTTGWGNNEFVFVMRG